MNRIINVILMSLALSPLKGIAQQSHVDHNMILLGSDEIFATHIVYKVPHNFQVILNLQLPPGVKATYQKEKKAQPSEQFRFVLKHIDISQIQNLASISGALIRVKSDGKKTVILDSVTLTKHQFKILFFDEVPLSLSADDLSD